MKIELTPKQEGFCRDYITTSNATEAYRRNYNYTKMKEATINRNAKKLMDNNKIRTRIAELQAELKQEFKIEKHELASILYRIANSNESEKPDSASKAIAELNKMFGFHAPKKIEMGGEITVTEAKINLD